MKIKSRSEILNDVLRDGKKNPKNWRAVFGKDNTLHSSDYYLFNPKTGIYLIKEYEKNPFVVKGIGSKIARHVDEDVDIKLSKHNGDFGIVQGDFRKIYKNIKKGMKPEKIFQAAINGKKDYGIKIPIKGKASSSTDLFKDVNQKYKKDQLKLDKKFEKLAYDDGLYSGYD